LGELKDSLAQLERSLRIYRRTTYIASGAAVVLLALLLGR
jgi:hypothetical protein